MHQRLIETVARLADVAPSGLRIKNRPPLDHQSNRLYDACADGRHLLVKEYLKPDEFATAPLYEHRALEILASLDVAPRPVGVELGYTSDIGPLVVYEYLNGEMWDRQKPSAAQLAALAEVWLKIHTLTSDQIWDARGINDSVVRRTERFRANFVAYHAWTEAAYPAGTTAAARCLDILARHWPVAEEMDGLLRQPYPRYFCRSDARFANVIQRPDGRLGLVDWEDCGLRDPARELSDLMYTPNQEDLMEPAEWRAFLDPYLAALEPRDADLGQRLHLYAAIYPLFWLSTLFRIGLERAQNGSLAGWNVNGMPANVRLRRYLARGLAWPASDFSAELAALSDIPFFPVA